MGTERTPAVPSKDGNDETELRFLQLCARLLLEYNVRTGHLKRLLKKLADHLGMELRTTVTYREASLITADGRQLHVEAQEFRINVAVTVTLLEIIDSVCENRISVAEGIRRLEEVEKKTPRHPRALVALLFGMATAAFSWLLGGDWGTIAVTGFASGVGVVVRQILGRLPVLLFIPPFVAALIGGIIGSIAIRLGWIQTPELCLIVPALMLVPGPHFINGVEDILENHVPSGIFRLTLALSIVLAAALGALAGGLPAWQIAISDASPFHPLPLTLLIDIGLAGLAASGIGIFYNSPWRVLWISILCGIVGHGLRFVCMQNGLGIITATLFACFTIGIIAHSAVLRFRLPFAAVAFAGAVTMMPGLFMFESIAGAIRLAVAGNSADPTVVVTTLARCFKATLIVAAMAIGLAAGARLLALCLPTRSSQSLS